MHGLRRLRPHCHPTFQGSQGAWSHADSVVNHQVRTLRASLDYDSGADSWNSGGYIVESLKCVLMLTVIGGGNGCVDVIK